MTSRQNVTMGGLLCDTVNPIVKLLTWHIFIFQAGSSHAQLTLNECTVIIIVINNVTPCSKSAYLMFELKMTSKLFYERLLCMPDNSEYVQASAYRIT